MKVYKYRGGAPFYCEKTKKYKSTFERDLESLKDDYFWAATRHTLNDPFECLFKDEVSSIFNEIKNIFSSNNANDLNSSLKDLLNFIDISGIYSLSKTCLSELLWSHYAHGHSGFCIEYDLNRLTQYKFQHLEQLNITYAQASSTLQISDLLNGSSKLVTQKMFGYKSKAWAYEDEIRILTPKDGRHDYDYRAVTAIYFGLRMKEDHQQLMMKTLKGRNIKYYQMKLKPHSYELIYEAVKDPFFNAPRYKYFIAPIDEHAIDKDSKKFIQYQDYLLKAAEVVRRDPYCKSVENVMFSVNKSTVQNPVIVVQYEITSLFMFNHYLTLKEIDDQYRIIDDL